MRKAYIILFIAIAASLTLACKSETDDAVKNALVCAAGVFDNPRLNRSEYAESLKMCGYDTNRYERLMMELASSDLTNSLSVEKNLTASMLRRIGEVGTTNSLPFLYECATNPVVGDVAVLSAIRIDGISSNVVSAIRRYLNLDEAKISDRAMCCSYLFEYYPCVANAPQSDKLNLAACVSGFAGNAYFCTRDIDVGIMSLDPSYQYSRRRLAVARSQIKLPLLPYGTNYVSGVIAELVAYPESSLSD